MMMGILRCEFRGIDCRLWRGVQRFTTRTHMEMWERRTEKDIQELVDNDVAESLDLEYKACGALQKGDREKNEVSKDVSAFANSGGGTIIYGVVEENHKPIKLDDGYDQDDISREWLENVITSRIHQKINGIKINAIERSNGKYIYLVYVPQSQTAHQAHNQKYYKRHNFKSEPMWDYEIRDVLNRVRHPSLEPAFSLSSIEASEQDVHCDLDIRLWNRGAVLAQNFALRLKHPLLMKPLANLRVGFEVEREVSINGVRYSSLHTEIPRGL